MIKRRRQLHSALFLGIGLAVSCLALIAYEFHFSQRLELTSVDTRFSVRGDLPTPKDVVVVGVDDVTFGHLNLQWPFPRSVEARVIDQLAAARAKVIAEDIQYTESTTPMPGCGALCVKLASDEDDALAGSIYEADHRNSKVVLSDTEVGRNGSTKLDHAVKALGARVGNGNYKLEADGVFRSFPYAIQKLETFPVVSAERALGRRLDPSDFPGKSAWIDFAGPPKTVPFLSFSTVFSGKFDPAIVRGKVVVVGATAPTLQDTHPSSTSGAGVMSGPEIQANAIETVLRGFPLQSVPSWVNWVAIFALGMIPAFLAVRFSAIWTILGAVLLGCLYAVIAQLAFNHGKILAFIYPLGALVVSTVGALAVHYLLVAFERQRTRDTFARFVPEEVVNQVLLQTGEGLRLGGARVFGTCMFTDLRGSTQFAESLPPETVVEVINRYLGELTEAILGHGGTLISYLGDGFMAVFGAPIEQEDHADRAVAAAREIVGERLPRFNEWLREHGHGDGFRIGVGLNTGPFMAGNVGSEKRLEYTAMGDTINTASRLEGLTKDSDFYLLMADSSREALVRQLDDVVPVGEVEVRGREGKLTVWSLEEARKPVAVPAA